MQKAQLEGMEQVLIIFIIVVIGVIFIGIFFKVGLGTSRIEQLQRLEQSAVEVATIVSAMPELQCTKNNVVTANCINKLKAEKMNAFIGNNKAFYHELFGFSRISVEESYPIATASQPIYDRSTDIPESKRKQTYSITLPRVIYDPRGVGSCFALGKGTCNYGKIKIEMFVR